MTRFVSPAAQAIRERRTATFEIPMVWISARNRETGNIEGIGVWQGALDENISVADMFTGISGPRPFYGRGELLGIGDIQHEAGLTYRTAQITLSAIGAAAEKAIREYEPRGAQCQVWTRAYDPVSMTPVAVEPWFKGTIQRAPIIRPEPGGEATITLEVVSTALSLTLTSATKKSHEAQKARAPGDTFRLHKAIMPKVDVPVGQTTERYD